MNELYEIYKIIRQLGYSHKVATKKVRKAQEYRKLYGSLEGFFDD